ncbi:CvpA family protein [Microbulbifer agarilyticus]|uniref:Colicin V production CvpA n=1 Tax=Microbulbifer agarilyticus TaxID=260552 RepID=A0A1Q2M7D3_9GAMM|nr:CvpA family protein [Microbulbifer agarilyticus]AQQ68207.1 colicin V production CvpA [Microbulbifer agarilyticus]MBY6191947.1 CvpA family protein [Microbulbifer agarilyticus]MBY6213136.1 CvpA family protein [Microbulbifer agarilyticus]MCA0894872.1 CvpA family protein [Microbulbifer agarilyticus]MCA0899089.1 CvpA family protein [Microbulbifer agarilyticus]
MNWADWTILAIIAISTLIGLSRGFVREVLSLLTWVAAFVVAMMFRDQLAPLLSNLVDTPSLQVIAAFSILFIVTLLAGAGLNMFLSAFVEATGLSGTDRVLGMVFGLFRGCIVVMALLIFAPALAPVDQDSWWQQSALIPNFLEFEDRAREAAGAIKDFFAAQFD